MSINSIARIRLISALVFLVAAILVLRLFSIQIVQGDYYRDRADRQYQRPSSNLNDRGTIYFQRQSGELVSAATMKDGFLLAIDPRRLAEPETVFARLTAILPLDRETFFQKAAKTDDPYEELVNHLDEATAAKIRNLKLEGVEVYKERWRFYPAGRLAAHVLGFMAYEGKTLAGRYGLEKFYNRTLERDAAEETFTGFLSRALAEWRGHLVNNPSQTEADLVLTIEPVVQQTLEKELASIKEKWQAEEIGGLVMDPQTGEVLALAALPNFDPGARQTDIVPLQNPLVEKVYEMGSIIKPLTMAAALDVGAVTASTTYTDYGFVEFKNRRIENYDHRGRGLVNMQEVLNQSLNTGAVFAMQRMGKQTFRQYFLNYGLDEETGIDLPNEATGLVGSIAKETSDIDYASASFGQSIALTPIATVRAMASLANGGRLVTPHVVRRFDYYNSRLDQAVGPVIGRQTITATTSREITRMLVEVVDTALQGGQVRLPSYTVAAKTGTAQIAKPGGSGYDDNRYLHSFFGYFPASAPRFLSFWYAVNPQGARYASETLTEPFINLTKFLLNYYHVPPDR